MITLSLDPSTKASGWAIYKDQDLYDHGVITASSSNLYNRIEKMQIEIDKIIKQYKVERVIIEDVLPQDVENNSKVYKALMYLQGAIMKIMNKNNLVDKVKFIFPSEWRKLCGIHTGRGIKRGSLKPKDIAFVKSQFDLSVGDDEADAIAIGFAAVGGKVKTPQTIVDDSGFEFA